MTTKRFKKLLMGGYMRVQMSDGEKTAVAFRRNDAELIIKWLRERSPKVSNAVLADALHSGEISMTVKP